MASIERQGIGHDKRKEKPKSLFSKWKILLMDTGAGLAGDTVATVSPPRFRMAKVAHEF
ncbi:MAG: hypothetical protein Q3985_02625 [Eubacteriales bacterium]|nr:hypothetical protein [Eubacteriales bacterium]